MPSFSRVPFCPRLTCQAPLQPQLFIILTFFSLYLNQQSSRQNFGSAKSKYQSTNSSFCTTSNPYDFNTEDVLSFTANFFSISISCSASDVDIIFIAVGLL